MERIQIAGIHELKEAKVCLQAGVRRLGFPLKLTLHKEDCTIEEAREICLALPDEVEKVVITYLDGAEEIVTLCRRVGVNNVQVHGNIELRELLRLKRIFPSLTVMKSLVVNFWNREALLDMVCRMAPLVDAFITDTYDPESGASGATGKTHDWSVSRAIVERSSKPVYLAGGLNPDNVGPAIRAVRPWGVDCHTGVEGQNGRKDLPLLRDFVLQANCAFREIEEKGLH
jgi:phosphoribosylanthranilate isomerase